MCNVLGRILAVVFHTRSVHLFPSLLMLDVATRTKNTQSQSEIEQAALLVVSLQSAQRLPNSLFGKDTTMQTSGSLTNWISGLPASWVAGLWSEKVGETTPLCLAQEKNKNNSIKLLCFISTTPTTAESTYDREIPILLYTSYELIFVVFPWPIFRI